MEYAALAVATALLLCIAWRALSRPRVKVVTVIDGDTLVIVTAQGKRQRLRITGIDAPETGQRGALEAKAALGELVHSRWVRVRWSGRDRYRRRLATVYVAQSNIAVELVRRGLVFPAAGGGYAFYSVLPRLARLGVWSLGQPRPEASLRRRWRLWGLFQRQRERRARRQRKR